MEPSEPTEPTEPEVTEPENTEPEVTEPEATEPEATEPAEPVQVMMIANQVIGSWANDRVGTNIGPERTYDGSLTTNWNPAVTGFNQEAAIVYTLDKSYDISKIVLTFGSRHHYITVSVSADGEAYTELATINSGNAGEYFTDLVCSLNDLTATDVKYIKVNFIGTANGTTWINLMEVQAYGIHQEVTEPSNPTDPEDDRPIVSAMIEAYQAIGTWVRDREGDSKIGPQMSYDESVTSVWNPQATNYKSGEGIVYTLDRYYDLCQIDLTFGTRQYYFTLHVSTDGESYTQVAQVDASNAAAYFTDLTCSIRDLDLKNVKFIKILFTGSANGTTYISLADIEIQGKELE